MRNRFFYLITIIAFLISCSRNPLKVDVSKVDFQVEILRVDQIFKAQNDLQSVAKVNNELSLKSEELYPYYTAEMLQVGAPNQDSTPVFLMRFISDSIMKIVQQGIDTEFGDFSSYENGIVEMFKHLKYHIPNAIMPEKIMTYNSTFTNGVLSTSNAIGLGLEMYLGGDNEIVQQIPFPEYFKKKMDVDFLLADISESWLTANVIEDQSDESFLSNLIYYGKLYYLIKSMLPDSEDHKILRYTADEEKWAEENEYDVWQHIVEQNWVYSSEMKLQMRYFRPAPTTVGIEGSPAKLGQFIGWKIVNAYMENYPEVTVKELVAERNFTKILKSYKPNRK